MMRVLIIGSGGREHAFAWKLKQSLKCEALFAVPGNPGISEIATCYPIPVDQFEEISTLCLEQKIDLVLVGPEVPLVLGIRDYLLSVKGLENLLIVGPDRIGAQLEGSKDFSKSFMQKYKVPTAKAVTFSENQLEEAKRYVARQSLPIVLKADGLAAGKGVIIAQSYQEAFETLDEMLANQKFGKAGSKVLVEQFLEGIEVSVFVLTDGKGGYVILPEAKDYKRIGEGDTGLNTGGMGAVSPVAFVDDSFMGKVRESVILPTLKGLIEEGIDYKGFIFIGLMNVGGEPFVIEYNARMGDPETEAVLPRIENDLLDYLQAAANGSLSTLPPLTVSRNTAATVVLVSGGYPSDFKKGFPITGVDKVDQSIVFHAGTSINNNQLVNTGGRVFAVTSIGENLEHAIQKSMDAAHLITWEGRYFRKDIGKDLLNWVSNA